ncbi:hypothetical protein [Wolbachia endosymbiont of Brugia pahangi]|uniref:hypothetical protein n=2 Tax=unclassified Wolbachia TaxID=2640676 RepID=UPI00143A42AA|nr:hypothetical protein [Wolbachia endosymbiont of Brugia pahangi]
MKNIEGQDFGVGLLFYNSGNPLTGVLKFINFYDENNLVLQKDQRRNRQALLDRGRLFSNYLHIKQG